MKNYSGIDLAQQREKLLACECIKQKLTEITGLAQPYITKSFDALKMSDFMLFYTANDRRVYEDKYYDRRNACAYLAAALWLSGDKKYVSPLTDVIFHICDEFTWCVPAHSQLDSNPPMRQVTETIDLFAAETASLLIDVLLIAGDKLPPYAESRIGYEIQRRIISAMHRRKFGWEHESCTSNWAAVCSKGTAEGILYFGSDEDKQLLLPRISTAISHFLSGYHDDGCCIEGYSYWNFGFGCFLELARTLFSYSGGKINYFKDEKVKNIALFVQRVRMCESKIVSFSDADSNFRFSEGYFSFLKSVYPEFSLPDLKYCGIARTSFSLKDLMWFDTSYTPQKSNYQTTFFSGAQWYIKQGESYCFAAKGGNNGESHNHNDIGSFMITSGEDIPLADFGAAEYVNGSFNDKIRYTIVVNGSQGHSVPIIDGKTQCAGAEFFAKNVLSSDSGFSLDIEGAYENGLCGRINRSFKLNENGVVLTDTFMYSETKKSIVERIASFNEPKTGENFVDLDSAVIYFDSGKYTVCVSSDAYKKHGCGILKIYLIDFTAISDNEHEFTCKIVCTPTKHTEEN